MANGGTLRDLEIRSGRISYLDEKGMWKTRPVTEEDIRNYNRDCLVGAIRNAVLLLTEDGEACAGDRVNYLRPTARQLCYAESQDLGLIYDSIIYHCGATLNAFFSANIYEIIVDKCTESHRLELVGQYENVRQKITSSYQGNDNVFIDYINRVAEKMGIQGERTVFSLANSLGRFPLFFALDKCISLIDTKLVEVAKNRLCIYRTNSPLNEEQIQDVAKYYSKIKYRLDAFIRSIQDEIEPLGYYRNAPVDEINAAESTSFSTSFHHYICFRLIPNTHYYGVLRTRTPDWVFTPKGREIYYANLLYYDGIRKLLDEALMPEPSPAMTMDKGDIRFCFDRNRYDLVYGDVQSFALSDMHRLTSEEKIERFKKSTSGQVVIPERVINECNRMLSILGTGKRIENYILKPDF